MSETLTEILNALQELGKGTDQITQALSSLVGASAAVKDSTNKIDQRAGRSTESLARVANLSRQNHEGIMEISRALDDIGKSLNEINGLGAKNMNSLDTLDKEIGRFTIQKIDGSADS